MTRLAVRSRLVADRNSDAAQMLLTIRIGLRPATHSFKRSQADVGAAFQGLLKGPLWVDNVGKLRRAAAGRNFGIRRGASGAGARRGGGGVLYAAPGRPRALAPPGAARRLRACRGSRHVGARPCGG